MFRCLPDFENCYNYTYDQNSQNGIFIFHGFPSQKNRNKDLAFNLFQNTKASVFVHHYEGIGESLGLFYFKKSVDRARRYVTQITKEFNLKKIHFVGHSWGGFISLNLLPDFSEQLQSLVLYSPFTEIPDGKGVDELADALIKEYPHLFFHRTRAEVVEEFSQMQMSHRYKESLEKIGWQKPTLILQALNDLATPEARTRAVLPLFGKALNYTELEVDHSFTQNRSRTFDLTNQFYKNIHLSK